MSIQDTFRILSLDGGGAKGIYTLGVLDEFEKNTGQKCSDVFNLIYGTSTGAIIATFLSKGISAEEILGIYSTEIPKILGAENARLRTLKLSELGNEHFNKCEIEDLKTLIGIVTTDCTNRRPKIFKNNSAQAFSRKGSFQPFFGASIKDALLASSAAIPYFHPVVVETKNQGKPTLIDGGFVANNPTLFALNDAALELGIPRENIAVLSVGTGWFGEPSGSWLVGIKNFLKTNTEIGKNIRNFEVALAANSASTDFLVSKLYSEVRVIRIDEKYDDHKCGLLTTDRDALLQIETCGRDSFGRHETGILELFS